MFPTTKSRTLQFLSSSRGQILENVFLLLKIKMKLIANLFINLGQNQLGTYTVLSVSSVQEVNSYASGLLETYKNEVNITADFQS